MGSNYFGEPNLGSERSGSSRKGKKSNSDKPKQPQRGLGVAQLEKIRLHGEMGCSSYLPSLHNTPYPSNLNQEDVRMQTAYSTSSSFSYSSPVTSSCYGIQGHQSIMMGLGELEGSNIRYGDSQLTPAARWNPGNAASANQYIAPPSMTRHLLNLPIEDSVDNRRKKDRSDSMASSSQDSETSDSKELDLELRLSL